LFLTATHRIKNKFELGFKIDLFGYAFAANKTGKFFGDNSSVPMNTNVSANTISYLLYDIYDVGITKAEVTFGYWLNNCWMLEGGLSDFIVEYNTPKEIQKDKKRFKDLIYLTFVAIRYLAGHN
jgi:hypothetical protein